jgi:hypothetical protein
MVDEDTEPNEKKKENKQKQTDTFVEFYVTLNEIVVFVPYVLWKESDK